MKNYFLIAAFMLMANQSYAVELRGFDEIKQAVIEGKLIRLYINYSKCNPSNSLSMPNVGAVHTMNEVALTSDNHIVNWLMHFTMNKPKFPSQPVYEYIRYNISNDNSVLVDYSTLKATDYTSLDESGSLNCKVGESAHFFI